MKLNTNVSMRMNIRNDDGFTLIEMMVSMAMGLVLIAGLASVFTSMGKTSSTVSAKTERMGDLYLMSQIMQEELRLSRATLDKSTPSKVNDLQARRDFIATKISNYPMIGAMTKLPYWDYNSRTLTYQNIDGLIGVFIYHYQGSMDSIDWLRPDVTKVDELSRNMDVNDGMCALDISDTCSTANIAGASSFKLLAAYLNESHQNRTMSLSFMVWPRN